MHQNFVLSGGWLGMFFDGLVHAFPIDAINLTILMIQFPRLQPLINLGTSQRASKHN